MSFLQAVNELPFLQGTFIEDLAKALENKTFSFPGTPMNDGEQVVGEMNELEQALYFLTINYSAIEEDILERFPGVGELCEPGEVDFFEVRLQSCGDRFEIASKMLWDSIQVRLVDKNNFRYDWALRAGGKIVLLPG